MRDRVIRISGEHYQELRAHLLPGRRLRSRRFEACVVALIRQPHRGSWCQKLLLIPYDLCHERSPIRVSWPAGVG